MLTRAERARRTSLVSPLASAADSYIVDRGHGRTILAGFPWFTDWGRDTFIAMRGLVLATGRLADAAAILDAWAGTVSQGMLPNRFPDSGDTPEYNSVDASLWFVVAVHEFLRDRRGALSGRRRAFAPACATPSRRSCTATSRARATASAWMRTGCCARASPGVQLTWMDAKVGDWVVTPRIGKPVEVQALWINALRIGAEWSAALGGAGAAGARLVRRAFLEPGDRRPRRRGRRRSRARRGRSQHPAEPDFRGGRAAIPAAGRRRGARRRRRWSSAPC